MVVLTDDLDAVLRFASDVAKLRPITHYETVPEEINTLFGWPIEHGKTTGAFVGEGAGSLDVLQIPEALRGTVQPGVRLLAVVNRDAAAAAQAAADAGYSTRGPFRATTATGGDMTMSEVVAGGVAFELVQFG